MLDYILKPHLTARILCLRFCFERLQKVLQTEWRFVKVYENYGEWINYYYTIRVDNNFIKISHIYSYLLKLFEQLHAVLIT